MRPFIQILILLLASSPAFAQLGPVTDAVGGAADAASKPVEAAKDTAGAAAGAAVGALSEAQRAYVDQYLTSHGLNQYGDPAGTMYTGGTPLFDETTGTRTDRYVYILRKNPGILQGFGQTNRK